MATSKMIFITTILLELIGFLLFSIKLRAFYDTYTDTNSVLVKRIIGIIGFIMILIGAVAILVVQIKKNSF